MSESISIDIHEAKKMIDDEDLTIVDIRDPASYAEAHIKNANQLSSNDLEEFLRITDKNKKLICYCYHGISSMDAVGFFKSKGFERVYSIEGGFESWREAYPYHTENQ